MNCDMTVEELIYHLDNQDRASRERLEKHIEACPKCRRMVRIIRKTECSLSELKREPVPEMMELRIRQKLNLEWFDMQSDNQEKIRASSLHENKSRKSRAS